MQERIGVTIVAGFLGSGKTTLLRRIVRDPMVGPRAAVLVNEFGALGLDEEIIEAEAQTPALTLRQLTSGCICCTLRGDLVDALRELASGRDRPPPGHLFIETSGAARATEVSYAVNAIGFEEPLQTDAVVTLVDAHNARRARREHPDLFFDQLRAADLVLLNKGDLVPEEVARAALLGELQPLAPRASWLWTEQASLDVRLLVGQVPLGERAAPGGTLAPESGHHEAAGGPAEAAHGLTAFTLPVPAPLRRDALENALEELADTVFRIKGVVDVRAPAGDMPLLVQAVGDRIDLDEIQGPPLSRSPRRLIFIGTALDRARIAGLIEGAAASS